MNGSISNAKLCFGVKFTIFYMKDLKLYYIITNLYYNSFFVGEKL